MLLFKSVVKIGFLFLLYCNCNISNAFVDKAVMIHTRLTGQHDTVGFNLAQELPDFIYLQLKQGKLTLWDSPKKQTKINFVALQQIEKASNTAFNNCSDIFLHEFWNCSKRSLSFVIAGFSFAYKNQEVFAPFGYIDAKEAFNLLAKTPIPCNANAPADLTFWEAINSKRYAFNIVQYGGRTFEKKPMDAVKLRDKIFNGKRKLIPGIPWLETKNIGYELVDDLAIDKDWSIDVKKGIEELLNKDKNIVNMHGGSAYFDTGNYRGYFAVTGLEIHETWQKREGLVFYFIDSMIVYVNNKRLTAFSNTEIDNLRVTIRFKTISDILKEKNFKISIFKINRNFIEPKNKEAYKKALESYKWTQISEYVKYINAE